MVKNVMNAERNVKQPCSCSIINERTSFLTFLVMLAPSQLEIKFNEDLLSVSVSSNVSITRFVWIELSVMSN